MSKVSFDSSANEKCRTCEKREVGMANVESGAQV